MKFNKTIYMLMPVVDINRVDQYGRVSVMSHYNEQREEELNKPWLMLGDCLERMKEIESGSVDMILTDPPYGTTACKWDSIIPLEPMWEQLKRIIKPNGAIVMTASQPFTTTLIASNMKGYCYNWVWNKHFAGNFVQAKRQPLKDHEDVCIFSVNGKMPNYYPLKVLRSKPIKKGKNEVENGAIPLKGKLSGANKTYTDKNPTTGQSLDFNVRVGRGLHPTQKPVALMEYLIKPTPTKTKRF